MLSQVHQITEELPYFLQDYGKLLSHFKAEFEPLSSREKGNQFEVFTQRLIPHSEIGRKFEYPTRSPKATYDEGIDLFCRSENGLEELYVQAKYSIPGVDEFDLIMSKFESYKQKRGTELQPKLIPDPDEQQRPISHFMIVTIQDLYGRTLPRYLNSKRKSLEFYNALKKDGHIHIIDGPQVLRVLQETYRKSYLLPTKVHLPMAEQFIHMENVYIGIVAGSDLKRLYEEFGNALFLENIREYLGPTSGRVRAEPGWVTVNQAIAHTITDHPDEFLARNNGVVFRASSVTQEGNSLVLDGASIVNGCQTTMAIVQSDEPKCFVLVKVVETSDAWDIAEAANFQNEIDQITLTLARYVRPQMIRGAAMKSGVRFEGSKESSAFAVLDSIYEDEITEKEFRALFLGFFSNSPRNAFANNYARVNVEVINQLFSEGNPDKDTIYELLFRLHQMTQAGAIKVENALQDDEDLLDLFRRFWKEDRPSYRAFLTILASCGCSKRDIFSKANLPTYQDTMELFRKLQIVIDQKPDVFLRYYHLAFTTVALDSIGGNQSRQETLQQMWAIIQSSNFENFYLKLRTLASADYWLRQKENSSS